MRKIKKFNQYLKEEYNIKDQFDNVSKMKMFEIEVLNNDNEKEYIICKIKLLNNKLIAERNPVSTEEEYSDNIATTEIEIDEFFTLDENLNMLYDKIIEDINNGDLYEIP